MTNSIQMTNRITAPLIGHSPFETTGRLSMISMMAISAGMAAAPAQAQDMPQEMMAPAMTAPVQAPPAISPQSAPASSPVKAPTIAVPPAGSVAAAKAETTPPVSQERADDLARKGGFDVETVAPAALAQIEREQQERKAAAAKVAAASAGATNGPVASSAAADNRADGKNVAQQPAATSEMSAVPDFETEGTSATVAAIPAVPATPEAVASPDASAGEAGADWGLLAALAALLGAGSAGAYVATRRRKSLKSKAQTATAVRSSDPLPAPLNAATTPELRRDRVEPEVRPMVDTDQAAVHSLESKATTKADFAQFVAKLPAFEAPLGKTSSGVTIGQRRVAAAPRPYLAEADLSRTAGYFTANVDAMPTPQNPFLTRQKRLKRARFLDGKLSRTKAPIRETRTTVTGEMQVSRPLEPAFS